MSAIVSKLASFMGFEANEETVEEYIETPKEKVMRINDVRKAATSNRLASYEIEHVILAPEKFEDAKRIADEIKGKKIITLNMSGVTFEVARRILDFISGTAYAVDARITKVSDNVFTLIPEKVRQINELPSKENPNEILNARDNAKNQEEITRKIAK